MDFSSVGGIPVDSGKMWGNGLDSKGNSIDLQNQLAAVGRGGKKFNDLVQSLIGSGVDKTAQAFGPAAGNIAAAVGTVPTTLSEAYVPKNAESASAALMPMPLPGGGPNSLETLVRPGYALENLSKPAAESVVAGRLARSGAQAPGKNAFSLFSTGSLSPELQSAEESSSQLPGTIESQPQPAPTLSQNGLSLGQPYDKSIARIPNISKGGYGSLDSIATSKAGSYAPPSRSFDYGSPTNIAAKSVIGGAIHPDLLDEMTGFRAAMTDVQGATKATDALMERGITQRTMDALKQESLSQFDMHQKLSNHLGDGITPAIAGRYADGMDRAIYRYQLGTTDPVPPEATALADKFRSQASPGE